MRPSRAPSSTTASSSWLIDSVGSSARRPARRRKTVSTAAAPLRGHEKIGSSQASAGQTRSVMRSPATNETAQGTAR